MLDNKKESVFDNIKPKIKKEKYLKYLGTGRVKVKGVGDFSAEVTEHGPVSDSVAEWFTNSEMFEIVEK